MLRQIFFESYESKVRKFDTIKTKFLQTSELGQHQVWFFQYGGGREGLNFQNIKAFLFPYPESSEQIQIIIYINQVSKEIDQAISQAENEIALIKEYKESLISEAVTGKIDVRKFSESVYEQVEGGYSLAAEESPKYSK